MRLNFELPVSKSEESRSLTPKEEVQWVALKDHPVFCPDASSSFPPVAANKNGILSRFPRNLIAWDGASRLYFWDSARKCLHRISLRLGEPEPTSVLAAFPSKVLSFSLSLNVFSLVPRKCRKREGNGNRKRY